VRIALESVRRLFPVFSLARAGFFFAVFHGCQFQMVKPPFLPYDLRFLPRSLFFLSPIDFPLFASLCRGVLDRVPVSTFALA